MQDRRTWSLEQWLTTLENRHPVDIQLGINRVKEVGLRLNLLSLSMPVITVAGTNGKGSTVSSLEAIYHSAGYRVGVYTSPHLLRFNERIRINALPMSDRVICQAFLVIEQARQNIHLTYFETATLAALWCFKKACVDVMLLEVGMGGRLDATNIVDASLAIITTIDLDHQAYLGDTIEKIGYEKAGILRENIKLIYADVHPPQSIINRAKELAVNMINYGDAYQVDIHAHTMEVHYKDRLHTLPKPRVHMKAAAAAIIASLELHHYLPVTNEHRQEAMRQVFIPGRQQVVVDKNKVATLYDVAHNTQAVLLLADFVAAYPKNKVHAVFSALADKDILSMLDIMQSHVDYWYPALLEGKRALGERQLLQAFNQAIALEPSCFINPAAAYKSAKHQAQQDDMIIVFGSFLTVCAVMALTEPVFYSGDYDEIYNG